MPAQADASLSSPDAFQLVVWRRHFMRPLTQGDEWQNRIEHESSSDTARFGQLYSDCFDHHIEISEPNPRFDILTLQDEDDARCVSDDNITGYFQHRLLDSESHDFPLPGIFRTGNKFSGPLPEKLRTSHVAFFDLLCADPVTRYPDEGVIPQSRELGSNRVVYLLGRVGIGKSLLLSLAYQHVARVARADTSQALPPPASVPIPVYLSMEELSPQTLGLEEPEVLHARFLRALFHASCLAVEKFAPSVLIDSLRPPFSDGHGAGEVAERLAKLCRLLLHERLGQVRYRLVIIIDNVDAWHYPDLRYLFFQHHYEAKAHRLAIRLTTLLKEFEKHGGLESNGLCICVAMRSNLPRELEAFTSGAKTTDGDTHEHAIFQLEPVTPVAAIESRLKLFRVSLQAGSETETSWIPGLELLQARLLASLREQDGAGTRPHIENGLNTICKLSHQGLRSVVAFLGALPLHIVREPEVIERLLPQDQYPRLLERLYITNGRHRFSQQQRHFPNMFVVDGFSHESVEPVVHTHTYWLKFLLLRRIRSAGTIRAGDVVWEFRDVHGFEEGIIRLALGSLASVNESACIERLFRFHARVR